MTAERREPISPAMVARSHVVSEPRWSPSGALIGWLDRFDSRADLILAAPGDAAGPPMLVTADCAVNSSGGGWCFVDDGLLIVAAADGRLLLVRSDGGGVVRVLSCDGRAFAPAVSPDGLRVAFCVERDDACDVAVAPLDGSQWPQRVSRGADFAWDPSWSADSATVVWQEWDLPNMPWDSSRVTAAVPGEAPGVIGGGLAESVYEPRFSPDGARLAFFSDRSGHWNVWLSRPDGSGARPLAVEPHDQLHSLWGPGARSYAWSPRSDAIAFCRNEAGFGRLVVAGVGGRRRVREVGKAFHTGLDWGPRGVLAVRSGARTPEQVVISDPLEGTRHVVARGPAAGFETCGLAEPEAVSWKTGRNAIHGLLYRPVPSSSSDRALPPLLVDIHGGPTGQSLAEWRATVAFWVSRGWAVLAPNYRGSTGFGRDYRVALEGGWGEVDVTDVAAGIRHAGKVGWADPDRVAVIGGSAGGLTVLLLCARHGDLVRAGVSRYGVTDLFDLAATTHRFESRYLDALVGQLPRDAAVYRDRSPITLAASMRTPLLVLQGDDDKVVPPAQAEAMVAALRAAGAPVEFQRYGGEGHGFRKLTTITDELQRTEAFLDKWVLQAPRSASPGERG